MIILVALCSVIFSLPSWGKTVRQAHKPDEIPYPFAIRFDPIKRILLVNFTNDPDSIYEGFEPQVMRLSDGNEAHLVIGWRLDGRVDVYHDPRLQPDSTTYRIAGKGLSKLVPTVFAEAEFRMTTTGITASYDFRDAFDRQVSVVVSEHGHKKRKPFSLLAPMGLAASEPQALPFLLLHDFYFVRRKNTELHIRIGGRLHEADKLAFPIDGKRMYFTRYSMRPVIASFLPAAESTLPLHTIHQNTDVELNHDASGQLISATWYGADYPVTMHLDQAMPPLNVLFQRHTPYESRFTLSGHKSAGMIGGTIKARRDGDTLHLVLQPTDGWKPRPDRLSLRILYRAAAMFRHWPKNYLWQAKITKDAAGKLFIQSHWTNHKPQ